MLDHLNRIYCVKSHLVERFSEIVDQEIFEDLRAEIEATIKHAERQIAGMDKAYKLLKIKYSFQGCDELINLLEKVFEPVQQQTHDIHIRDMVILSYMTYVKAIESGSFRILQSAAAKIKNFPIRHILMGNYEEAKLDRALLSQLTTKYGLTL